MMFYLSAMLRSPTYSTGPTDNADIQDVLCKMIVLTPNIGFVAVAVGLRALIHTAVTISG